MSIGVRDGRARVRPAAVAGAFYPVRADTLSTMVDEVLASVPHIDELTHPVPPGQGHDALGQAQPKAIIVPHAGYIYSAPIAATAYAQLLPWRDRVSRVVLLGPAHRVAVRSMAVSGADAWATPLGSVALDAERRDVVVGLPGVVVDDQAHAPEHSLEVHVPFLQRVLGNRFVLLPIIVGGAPASEVADVLDAVWGGDETLIVISTDLSHYHDQATAVSRDTATCAAIVGRSTDIDPYDACGAYPVRGMLTAAARHGLGVELLDRRTSADTAGTPDRVVGYGAFVLRPTTVAATAPDAARVEDASDYTDAERAALLDVATAAIRARFRGIAFSPADAEGVTDRLRAPGAAFVTLRDGERLLGCIGTMAPVRPLVEDVADNAVGAAFHDPRMPALTPEEYQRMSVHISVLTPTEPMPWASLDEVRRHVRPGVDGLVVEAGRARGTFLPSVWEQVPDVDDFLAQLWRKAGLRPGSWPAGTRVARYQTIEWGDEGPRPAV